MLLSQFGHAILLSQGAIVAAINENNKRLREIDEEEEQENQICVHVISVANMLKRTSERRVWRHPTSNDWWENIFPVLSEDQFRAHFRVDKAVFTWLCNELREYLFTKDNNIRRAVPVEKKVAVSLKCLATTCDLLTIAALFGLGRSSVHKYFLQFVHAMYQKIVPNSIKFPKPDQVSSLAKEFEDMWGFPMAIGAIDGSHIPFNPPVSLATDFHNYKGWRSIIVIAMCDAKGKVLWLKSGMPGRMSDSGAFKQTNCYQKFSSGEIIPPISRNFFDVDVPYMVLGDSGFAMEKWHIKPFTYHSMLEEKQKIFNYRHSRARRSVENLFGRAKMRWRRLLKGLDVTYKNAHQVIAVCFALHNICEDYGIVLDVTPEDAAENQDLVARYPQPASSSQAESFSGAAIRNALMEYFCSQENPWRG